MVEIFPKFKNGERLEVVTYVLGNKISIIRNNQEVNFYLNNAKYQISQSLPALAFFFPSQKE